MPDQETLPSPQPLDPDVASPRGAAPQPDQSAPPRSGDMPPPEYHDPVGDGGSVPDQEVGGGTPDGQGAADGSGGLMPLFGFVPGTSPFHDGGLFGFGPGLLPFQGEGFPGSPFSPGGFGGLTGPNSGLFGPDMALDFLLPVTGPGFGPQHGMRPIIDREDDDIQDDPRHEPQDSPYDPLFSQQWYIQNTSGGVDLNVVKAWEDFTGEGVRVAVCDNGVDYNHPDLQANYLAGQGYNETSGVADGYPGPGDTHGTAVAGFIAAAKNGYGIQGIAYDAKIASFVDGDADGALTGIMLRQTSFDISQNSWTLSPFQDTTSVTDAVETLARDGRSGLGTVVVFAGSNERGLEIMSTYYNTNCSPYGLAVGAVDSTGKYADFSCAGPNLLVTAPGDTVLSTDRTPPAGEDPSSYFHVDSGTSFSSPMVSGVIALMLEANPDLGYRDVQTILAATAVRTDAMVSAEGKPWDWQINGESNWNGGGMHASHDYGFGLVDATAAVRLAESWDSGQHAYANQVEQAATVNPSSVIPDNTGASLTTSATINTDILVQHAVVTVDIAHARFDDLEISLTSPDGTQSVLLYHPNLEGLATEMKVPLDTYMAERTPTFGEGNVWSFMTVTPFGEHGQGDWTLTVTDTVTGDQGTLNSWTLTLYGDNDSAADQYIYTDEYSDMVADDASRATLTDTAGTDTINASAVTADCIVNLTPGATGVIDGTALVIGAATVIENVHTGDGNDVLIGNDADNNLFGWRGDDNISGGIGDDLLFGGTGMDTLSGGTGSDIFSYSSADEGRDSILDFSHAADVFHFDYAEFGQSSTGVLSADHFFVSSVQVDTTDACFYFEVDILWYDADGTGDATAEQIAQVMGDLVQTDDIVFV